MAEIEDEGAPQGAFAYLEMLLDALADGDISETESAALGELFASYSLSPESVSATHNALMLALAHRAVDDGHVSRAERSELDSMAALLSVPADKVLDVIKHADSARSKRLSAGLKILPADWAHGEPLRVGDRVAFTGCDEQQRERLEEHANGLGVRVLGNLSRLSVMLVTDGSFTGTKAIKAQEPGTRIVHPDHFEVMLTHLQPTLAVAPVDAPRKSVDQGRPSASEGSPRLPTSAPPSTIRTWALTRGYEVGVRGRLPAEVIEAFEASTVTS
ncbi:hypothetical protein IWX78_003247 [Mycetocola sp. CAN_C7]|uniref:Lsr2 family DNA-binding protein n=1 Tax=Mycetocola sp. CAN_C7 TaxID=2787724 RepID=UPI001A243788